MVEYRQQITVAVTWRIIAELMRRHHARCCLRLLEVHPSCDDGNCLSLFSWFGGSPFLHLLDFLLTERRFRVWHSFVTFSPFPRGPAPYLDREDYVERFLCASDPLTVVDTIEGWMRPPFYDKAQLPPPTPSVLMFGLIAELLERASLGQAEPLDLRCGWLGTNSPEARDDIRPELEFFPSIKAELPYDARDWQMTANVASRHWLLQKGGGTLAGLPLGVIDLRGLVYFTGLPTKPWNVWADYQANGHNLLPLVHHLEGELAGEYVRTAAQ